MTQRRKLASGQSIVEFALFIPIIALLLSGLAAFGFLLYAHVQVTNATREGARAGALYLGGRFKYTSTTGGTNCWTLRDWVENGMVERSRITSGGAASLGCPVTSMTFNTGNHAFGLLSAEKCTAMPPVAPTTTDCWWLEELRLNAGTNLNLTTSSPAQADADALNIRNLIASSTNNNVPLTVTVAYQFNVPFIGTAFNTNPLIIRKTVIMRMQNN